jgi:predicted lysophospholipase L1 biosynthesis ABC-type transport system permease subunit
LLLLGDEMATDLAIDTARDEENEVLVREVAAVLEYPTRVTTRAQMLGAYRTQLSERGGLGLVMLAPALMAVVLLVLAAASGGPGARHDVGKLKLIGWSTGDVVRLHGTQMGLVGFAAVGLGLIAAYVGVHVAGGSSVVAPLLGIRDAPPRLVLDTEGAVLALVVVGACVLLPCMIAALVPAMRLAREDPTNLLEDP